MSCLVDTNVLSELVRSRPNEGVTAWASKLSRAATSTIVIEEVFFGLALKPNHRVRAWLEAFFRDDCDVLPVTFEIARHAGELRAQLQADGQTRTQADMMIAATAAVHGLTLVTRNERDFQGCHIAVMNPFS